MTFKAVATPWGKHFHYLLKKEQLQACWNATQLIIVVISVRVPHIFHTWINRVLYLARSCLISYTVTQRENYSHCRVFRFPPQRSQVHPVNENKASACQLFSAKRLQTVHWVNKSNQKCDLQTACVWGDTLVRPSGFTKWGLLCAYTQMNIYILHILSTLFAVLKLQWIWR